MLIFSTIDPGNDFPTERNLMNTRKPATSAINLFDLRASFGDPTDGTHDLKVGRWINGRVIAVLGTPNDGSSSDMAYGVSLVPAGATTPSHSHRAEELAMVLEGRGEINIDGQVHPVRAGDVLLTPPNLVHSTKASNDGSLSVLWVYAPAGSEERWFAEDPEES